MAKPRVHEIAAELGVDSKIALAKLKELGEFVKSPSSTIEPPVARKLRAAIESDASLKGSADAAPAAAKPAAAKPGAAKPGAAKPGAAKPGAAKPGAGAPTPGPKPGPKPAPAPEASAAAPAPEAPAEAAEPEAPARKPRSRKPAAKVEALAETAPAAEDDSAENDDGTPRRGWWQRTFG